MVHSRRRRGHAEGRKRNCSIVVNNFTTGAKEKQLANNNEIAIQRKVQNNQIEFDRLS